MAGLMHAHAHEAVDPYLCGNQGMHETPRLCCSTLGGRLACCRWSSSSSGPSLSSLLASSVSATLDCEFLASYNEGFKT